MEECVDGEYQKYKARGRRLHPRALLRQVSGAAGAGQGHVRRRVWRLNRGGHDPQKVYAAYAASDPSHKGAPSVILAKTVKGYGLGEAGEGKNITHQQKKLNERRCCTSATASTSPSDEEVADAPFYRPAKDSPEMQYLHERRRKPWAATCHASQRSPLPWTPGDDLSRSSRAPMAARSAPPWPSCASSASWCGQDHRQASRAHRARRGAHLRHGGLFRQVGIYSSVSGQLYDAGGFRQLLYYKEDKTGQILEEGINEAGAMSPRGSPRERPTPPRHADDALLHLLLHVRLPAHRRPGLGRGRHAAPAASWSAPRPAAPRWPARACSTRTATATCWPTTIPTAWPTTRPSPTSWP
jgi:pyruvate dehydrogenase E1 component